MAIEIERKYLDADFQTLRSLLAGKGSAKKGARYELNLVYDNADGSFLKSQKLLRLRCNISASGVQWICTVKRPLEKENCSDFKIREELETETASGRTFSAMLEIMGFHLAGCYEKLRESWLLPISGTDNYARVELDMLPFCECVEIEGNEITIEKAESLLHLDKLKKSPTNYNNLYNMWLQKQGLPPSSHCCFDMATRERIAKALGVDPKIFPVLPRFNSSAFQK